MRSLLLCTLALLLASALPGCDCDGERAADGTTAVTLTLNWFPEAEHGGFYAAEVAGFYEEAALDVTIEAGRPDAPVLPQVATGRVEFGVVDASEILLARAQGVPVVAVMAPLQTNPRCILVRDSSEVQRLEDLSDVTLAMNVREPYAQFLRARLPLTNVRVVPYPGNVAQLLETEGFAQQAYVFSEPFVARENGMETRCLMVSELGFNPYASVLVTSERMIAEQPETVRRMVQATARGWERYVDEPRPVNDHIHELNPEMSNEILAFGADAILPLVRTDDTARLGVGAMTRERWDELQAAMNEAQLFEGEPPPTAAAFDTSFLSDSESDRE